MRLPWPRNPLGDFFLRTLLALAGALAIWYWGRELAVRPIAWLAEPVMRLWHGGWVSGVEQDGATLALLTGIRVSYTGGRVAELAPEVNALAYAFGLPFVAALLVGARARGLWWKLPVSALALLPFQVWGVCFSWLVQVAVHANQLMTSQARFSDFQLNAYGLGYQLGFLIFPTLIPVLLWLAFEREYVTRVALGVRAPSG